jgi:4-carboxymuconolactone decarboxylase
MTVPGTSNPVYTAVPQLGRLREEVLFGDVWQQPEMSPRDRSVVTIAVLAALGKTDELKVHMRRALDNGVTIDQLRGLVVQVALYAGWPCAVGAAQAGLELFESDLSSERPG